MISVLITSELLCQQRVHYTASIVQQAIWHPCDYRFCGRRFFSHYSRIWDELLQLYANAYPLHTGGAKGWLDGACALAVNPCVLAMPQQASHRHFILLCSTSFRVSLRIFCTKRGQTVGAHTTRRQDFESKFSQFLQEWHDTPNHLCVWGLPTPHHVRGCNHAIAGTQTIVPLIS